MDFDYAVDLGALDQEGDNAAADEAVVEQDRESVEMVSDLMNNPVLLTRDLSNAWHTVCNAVAGLRWEGEAQSVEEALQEESQEEQRQKEERE